MLVLMMIEDMLAGLGCQSVSTAATIKTARALIEARRYDFALLDMNLNGSQTYAIADALHARGVPFAFSTGYSGHEIRDGYSDRPVLKKPFSERELGDTLAGLLH